MKNPIKKHKLTILLSLCLLSTWCSFCRSSDPFNVERSYDNVIELLSSERDAQITKTGRFPLRKATVIFWDQTNWMIGRRYKIYVNETNITSVEVRGWYCRDNSMLPGYNPFTNRPLKKNSFVSRLNSAEHHKRVLEKTMREYKELNGDFKLN